MKILKKGRRRFLLKRRLSTIAFLVFIPFSGLFAQISARTGEEIIVLAQSPDGSSIATVSQLGLVRVRGAETNKILLELNSSGIEGLSLNGCRRVVFIGNKKLAVLGFKELRLFDLVTGGRIATYKSDEGYAIIISSCGQYAAFSSKGLTEIVALNTGKVLGRRAIKCHRGMDISRDGKRLYHFFEERNVVECLDIATGKILYWLKATQKINRILLAKDDNLLVGVGFTCSEIWDLNQRKIAPLRLERRTANPDAPFVLSDKTLILPDELYKDVAVYELDHFRKVPFSLREGSVTAVGAGHGTGSLLIAKVSSVFRYDLFRGDLKGIGKGLSDVFRSVCLSPDEKKLLLGTEDGYIKYFDLLSGTYRGVLRKVEGPVYSLSFDTAYKELEVGDGYKVDVYRFSDWKLIRSYKKRQLVPEHSYTLGTGGKFRATVVAGEITLSKGGRFLRITTLAGVNRDYFVYDNAAMLFDGSSKGVAELGIFRFDNQRFTARQLSDFFYRPELLALFFNDIEELQKIAGEADGKFERRALHPDVQLQNQGQELLIGLSDRGGGIGAVNVYLNRKLVLENAFKDRGGTMEKQVNWRLDLAALPNYNPSVTNRIEVKAYNKAGNLSGLRQEILIKGTPKVTNQSPITDGMPDLYRKPRLWALMVGVSEYASPDLFLSFAAKDAADMHKAIEAGGRILYEDRVNLFCLSSANKSGDLQPSAGNIRKWLRHIATHAERQDVILLYFAGHGQVSEKGDLFYFLGKDARNLGGNYTAEEAVSDRDILQTLQTSRCEKQVLILDACYSGQIIDRMAARGHRSSAIKAFERMSDQSAAFVLASSTASQRSWESSEFGQGLLTHYLLEGMKGPVLDDGILTVLKWMDYAKEQVEHYWDVRSEVLGLSELQTPRIFSDKDIFPLALAQFPDQATLGQIPVNAPKPLVGPPTLLNADMIDPIHLQKKLNETLKKGVIGVPFYYIANPDFPGTYRLTGSYQYDQAGKAVTLGQLKVFRGETQAGVITFEKRSLSEEEVISQVIIKLSEFCSDLALSP